MGFMNFVALTGLAFFATSGFCRLLTVTSIGHFLWKPFSVSAKRARLPVLPPSFAAAASFFAGIGFPAFAPSVFLSDPGFFIAPAIHFSAIVL